MPPQGLQQSPGHTRDFGANDQPNCVPRYAAHHPHPSSLPTPCSLNPELSVYPSLLQQGLFFFPSSPRSLRADGKVTGQDPARTQTCPACPGPPAWGQRYTPRTRGWCTGSPHCSLGVLIFGPSWESLSTEDAPGPSRTETYPWLEEEQAEYGFGTWLRWIPSPFPSHRHCLRLLSPVAFPALPQHPHPVAQGTRRGLPGPWAPLKPSSGRAPALCFPLTQSPVIHPLLLPDSPASAMAPCAHARLSVSTGGVCVCVCVPPG